MSDDFNHNDNQTAQPDGSYSMNGAGGSYGGGDGGNGGNGGSGFTYNPGHMPEEKPKKKGTGKKIFLSLIALVLVAAVAFTSGYYGVQKAYGKLDRVVVEKVESGSSATAAADTSASSGTTDLSAVEIAEKTVPSVVAITTEQMTTSNFWFGSQVVSGAGSGIIISEDGYIMTNNHVISGADTITVELQDGSTHTAELVGTYVNGDIAVIKIDATGLTLSPAKFADSDSVIQGETVYAVGNPEGSFSGSITQGIISALDRTIEVAIEDTQSQQSNNSNNMYGFGSMFGYGSSSGYTTSQRTISLDVFQFDAAVSPGNSGGGLFNSRGELIGIVCAKSSDTDSEGLGFAIVGNKAYEIASSIISTGEYTPTEEERAESGENTNKALLGITATYLDEQTAQSYGYSKEGVYVASVTAESTMKAGLQAGDRIISIDDVVVSALEDVTGYLADKEPGEKVNLNIERENKLYAMEITLVENTNN